MHANKVVEKTKPLKKGLCMYLVYKDYIDDLPFTISITPTTPESPTRM